jgi:hypothetical protein
MVKKNEEIEKHTSPMKGNDQGHEHDDDPNHDAHDVGLTKLVCY